jgi:hypothetical protein
VKGGRGSASGCAARTKAGRRQRVRRAGLATPCATLSARSIILLLPTRRLRPTAWRPREPVRLVWPPYFLRTDGIKCRAAAACSACQFNQRGLGVVAGQERSGERVVSVICVPCFD